MSLLAHAVGDRCPFGRKGLRIDAPMIVSLAGAKSAPDGSGGRGRGVGRASEVLRPPYKGTYVVKGAPEVTATSFYVSLAIKVGKGRGSRPRRGRRAGAHVTSLGRPGDIPREETREKYVSGDVAVEIPAADVTSLAKIARRFSLFSLFIFFSLSLDLCGQIFPCQ